MWIEDAHHMLVNMDWITAIEIYHEENSNFPYQIRAYEKSSEGWYCFGQCETYTEALRELSELRSKLISKQ